MATESELLAWEARREAADPFNHLHLVRLTEANKAVRYHAPPPDGVAGCAACQAAVRAREQE